MDHFFRKERCEHNDRYLCFSCATRKGAEIVASVKKPIEKIFCRKEFKRSGNIMEGMDVTGTQRDAICTCDPRALCDSVHDVNHFFDFCISTLEKMVKNGEKKTLEFEHRNERREMDITIRLQMKKKNYPKSPCEFLFVCVPDKKIDKQTEIYIETIFFSCSDQKWN
jgi:hypothetical protein